jgi:hypothetical protein
MKSHNNNINNILHMRRPSRVYENAKCGETALSPQCCRVQQISVSGCKKKPIWFIVEFVQTRWTLLVGFECRYPHTSLHGRETQQQSQSSWLLIPFCLPWQSSLPWISSLWRTSFWWISSIQPCKSSCIEFHSLWRTKILTVCCDPHRGRTCNSSSQLSLCTNLLAREIHRNQGTRLRLSLRSTNVFVWPSLHSTGLFASIVAISILVHENLSRSKWWFVQSVAIELKSSFWDRGRDHTSSSSPMQCSLRLDGATACHVALRRAGWSQVHDQGLAWALSCS